MPIVSSVAKSLPPSGAAGGDLGGTYPNPSVDLVSGGTISGALAVTATSDVNVLTPKQLGDVDYASFNAFAVAVPFVHVPAASNAAEIFSEVANSGRYDGVLGLHAINGATGARVGVVSISGEGGIGIYAPDANRIGPPFYVSPFSGSSYWWAVHKDGYEVFGATGTTPADGDVETSQRMHWYDDTATSPKLRFKQKDSAAAVTSGISEAASPITSGALPTATLSSGTGAQLLVARAVESHTPVTTDGTNNAATCAIALSPDNVTYSPLCTWSIAAAVNLVGAHVFDVTARVPAGWYLKLTVARATIGTTTYY